MAGQTVDSAVTSDIRPVVLVTGGAKRVGRAIATAFGAHGYRVLVHFGQSADAAHEIVDALRQTGVAAQALAADLRDADQIATLIDECYQVFGRLDVLINSASIFPDDHLEDFALDDFDHAWAVNARAPILLTRAWYRRARQSGQTGVVINVVDQKVRDNFHPDHFSYTVGKTAIGYLTGMLAQSAAPVLRVNAVYPGLMLASGDQTEADFLYASRHATPLGKVAAPDDLAAAILLLTAPEYNGVDWIVDAGQNLRKVTRDVVFSYRDPGRAEA